MSENMSRLAQKIDFSTASVEDEEMEESDSVENKELTSFQPSLWPWDSVRNKLRFVLIPFLRIYIFICMFGMFR